MIRSVIGWFFCFTAVVTLFVRLSDPRAAYHGGEIFAHFLFLAGIGVILVVFGTRSLSRRKRVIAAGADQLRADGDLDPARIAREVGAPEPEVRKILQASGLSSRGRAPGSR